MMTGQTLQQLLLATWGRSYDLQLRRTRGKMFLQVMWKYLEQASFPMTEAAYVAHLDAIAAYLQAWNSEEQVRAYLAQHPHRPRVGRAVSIPLELGERGSEWLLEEF